MNPFAYFDCLAISAKMARLLGNVSMPEVHLFAYIGCTLSLYRGAPLDAWQYSFAGTTDGSPFSAEIDDASVRLLECGLWAEANGFISVTDFGISEYGFLASLRINEHRDSYLEAACSSALALPVGLIRDAISCDPEMRAAARFHRARPLLNELARDAVYEGFRCIAELVGNDVRDLLIPAVVWIRYIGQLANS